MKIAGYIIVTGCSVILGWVSRPEGQPEQKQAPKPASQVDTPISLKSDDRTLLCKALAKILANPKKRDFSEEARQLVDLRPEDQKIWKALFEVWFARNPSGAWTFANDPLDREVHPSIYRLAISTWASIDANAASLALGDSPPEYRIALLQTALSSDPKLALTLIQNWELSTLREDPNFKRLRWINWIYELAKTNPDEITELLPELKGKDPFEDGNLLGAFFAGRAMANPKEALLWLSEQEDPDQVLTQLGNYVGFADFYDPVVMDVISLHLPKGDRRLEVMRYALERLAKREPMRAANEAQRLFSDPHQQAEILAIIAEDLLRTDFDAAWEVASRIDSSIHFLRRVSIPDAEILGTGTFQSHLGPTGYQSDLTNMSGLVDPSELKAQLLTKLLMVDRTSAIQHLSNLPTEDLVVIGANVLDDWVWYSPKEAFTFFANAIPPGTDPDNLWRLMNFGYHEEHLKEAFFDLPPGPFRSELAQEMAGIIAENSPAQAVTFLKEENGSSKAFDYAYWVWASQNPKEALEAITQDQEADPGSWESVVEKTFLQIPDQTIETLSELPSGEKRDRSLAAISGIFLRSSRPIDATNWALRVEDPELAGKNFDNIIDKISMDLTVSRDPQVKLEISALVSEAPNLSPDQKNRWIERIELELQSQ